MFLIFVLNRKRNGQIVDSKRDAKRDRMEGGDPENIALIIRDVTRHDMGNYTCELENEYGTGISEDAIIVNVHCKYNCNFIFYIVFVIGKRIWYSFKMYQKKNH